MALKTMFLLLFVLGGTQAQFGLSLLGLPKLNQPQEQNQNEFDRSDLPLRLPLPKQDPLSGRIPHPVSGAMPPIPVQLPVPLPLPQPEFNILNLPVPIPGLETLIKSMEPVDIFVKEILNLFVQNILFMEHYGLETREKRRYSYFTEEGTYHEECEILVNPGTMREEVVVIGADSTNDGEIESTTFYTTDKNGYNPRMTIKRRGIPRKVRRSMVS